MKFLPNIKREEFPAQTLALEIYKEAGIRGVEIGTILADRDPETRENRYPKLELVRLALPRRTITGQSYSILQQRLKNVFDRRDEITKGYKITLGIRDFKTFTVKQNIKNAENFSAFYFL